MFESHPVSSDPFSTRPSSYEQRFQSLVGYGREQQSGVRLFLRLLESGPSVQLILAEGFLVLYSAWIWSVRLRLGWAMPTRQLV